MNVHTPPVARPIASPESVAVAARAAPSPAAIREALEGHLLAAGRDAETAQGRDWLNAVAAYARHQIARRWAASRQEERASGAKRVCYLSTEFLLGRILTDTLHNLGLYDACRGALADVGYDLEDIAEHEVDAGLGNGGLGRLAACLMDSLATLGVPATGYGIRFEYGMFAQVIERGWQVERPDHWLRHGNPWEVPRPDLFYPVPFFGRVVERTAPDGRTVRSWDDAQHVFAMAYDVPICGFRSDRINAVRLWSAKAHREFDLARFNEGDHARAVEERARWESLTRVLYPSDGNEAGRELRFMQEYFFTSASIQDVLHHHMAAGLALATLPERIAININDTHAAIAVAELMRLLVDIHGLGWEEAWAIVLRTMSYTNHTLMPEALETWPVGYFERLLPRHLEIIYDINARFLDEVRRQGDQGLPARVSLVEERGERRVRMAHLAFVGSHNTNGVSQVHTGLLRQTVFADLHRLFPERIVNVTNGVTPRRWLAEANPGLAALISDRIGDGWQRDLDRLQELAAHADDPAFRAAFRAAKTANKSRFARYAAPFCGVAIDPASLFDVHVKRIHEYKRQLLKILHVVALYERLRRGEAGDAPPRTVIFAGKAAPSYAMAKRIIRLIHGVADTVNGDPAIGGRLKIVFVPNYGVSVAQRIIPAADLSEQISTAGTEASGTGNMKLALNGALTVGTLDGANIEIAAAVGAENIFIFGLEVDEVAALAAGGYEPRRLYEENAELRNAIDLIAADRFTPGEQDCGGPIVDSLIAGGDRFFVLADFAAYMAAQERAETLFRDADAWSRRAIMNVAGMGELSADRAVRDYAARIWNVRPRD